MMNLIYSFDEINKILFDFNKLTNFRIALFDNNFTEFLSCPTRLSRFCKTLREDIILNEKCHHCDFEGFAKCTNERKTIIYQCHMGMTEIISPIISSDTIIGYVMCGQFFSSDSLYKKWDNLLPVLKKQNVDIETLHTLHNKYTLFSTDILPSLQHYLEMIGTYLNVTGLLKMNKNNLAYQLDNYILKNISQPINVEMLCKEFHYQKTNFYKVTHELYGISIMKHVRNLKIQVAKNLLSSTDIPINQIAAQIGMDDYNYFTKLFKQLEKCTPKEFRRNSIKKNISI